MIVGRGLLAQRFAAKFADDNGVVVFASGVSNSGERNDAAFDREAGMLQAALTRAEGRFVYFSSCGVAASSLATPYMRHKSRMESLVLSYADGLVLRLPQVVGRTANPHTLTNFLSAKIMAGERFDVWANAERNLIDIDDVFAIACAHIDTTSGGQAVSIASDDTLPMPRIVEIFESVIGRSALYDTVDAGEPMPIENRVSSVLAKSLGIYLGRGYTETTIRKYYG